jgi:hypothetical protein
MRGHGSDAYESVTVADGMATSRRGIRRMTAVRRVPKSLEECAENAHQSNTRERKGECRIMRMITMAAAEQVETMNLRSKD